MALDGLHRMLEESASRRECDAKRLEEHDGNLCQMCHAYGEDKRSLFVSCFYAVHEVVPEAIDLRGATGKYEHLRERGYYVRLCKACRGRFLTMMGEWADACRAMRSVPKDHDGREDDDDPERNIPVRINGAVVMLTREEWDARATPSAATAAEERG